MKRVLGSMLLCILLFCILRGTDAVEAGQADIAFTEEENAWIERAEEITIAFVPNRPPLSDETEDGTIEGITVDIITLIEERSGLKFHYEMMPVGMRAIEYLEENPGNLIAGVFSDTGEFVSGSYCLSEDIYSDDVVLVCKAGMNYDIDAADVSYKLAIPKSYSTLERYVEECYPEFEIIRCVSTKECLRLVESGEADFAAQNVRVLEPLLSNPHFEDITVVPTFLMKENAAIVSLYSQNNEILMGIMNKCIATISDTEMSQIKVDHTVANIYHMTWEDVCYKYRYTLIAVAILLVTLILFTWSYQGLRKQNYLCLEEKNKELAEAVEKTRRANAAKSDFLARMSHEIRTPMNTIVSLAALAKQQQADAEKLNEDLDKIQISSELLLNLINDVLDMSAIELQKMKIASEPFDLQELFFSITAIYETECSRRNIHFYTEVEITDRYLLGDKVRVQQIMMNLLSNACKFTAADGSVTISLKQIKVEKQTAYYQLQVRDNGEGITDEMQQRLFLPFEQERADTFHKYGGSGLGLSIVKNLVELMDGTISCESEKGVGSRFTVRLSFVLAPQELREEQENKKEEQQEKEEYNYNFGGKTILLAEDTGMNADIMIDLLALVNLKTVWAKDGAEAVQLFEHTKPGEIALILMDIHMPVLNGYEAAQRIRRLNRSDSRTIPIFAMTANAFEEDIKAAQDAGMDEHIAKPVDISYLYRMIAKFLQK